jgi:hypothetical protein
MNALSITKSVAPLKIIFKTNRGLLHVQKQSPHILFGVGIVGFVATAALASKATLRVEEIVEKAQSDLEDVRSLSENETLVEKYSYDQDDATRDKIVIYSRSIIAIGKLYAPTLIVGCLSIAALTKAHFVLDKRLGAATAAYAGLEKMFRSYRNRIIDEIGEDRERDLLYDIKREKITILDQDTLETKTFEQKRVGSDGYSQYARFFDELSPRWGRDAELNFLFLRAQQNYANDLLLSRGHVFLNEVYDMLGIPRSSIGAIVGWCLTKDGDNFIDFGFMNGDNPRAREFVNGHTDSIFLDFNVDGVIYEKI